MDGDWEEKFQNTSHLQKQHVKKLKENSKNKAGGNQQDQSTKQECSHQQNQCLTSNSSETLTTFQIHTTEPGQEEKQEELLQLSLTDSQDSNNQSQNCLKNTKMNHMKTGHSDMTNT